MRACWLCHGPAAVSGGPAPDLRASPILLSRTAFLNVVLNGSLRENGMPGFPDLTESEAEGIRHYIRGLVAGSE